MSESFSVGEIAELVYSRFHRRLPNTDAEVVEPLAFRRNAITKVYEACYVALIDGERYGVLPDQLRKKRPPQDWKALCSLTDAPRELETA